MTEIRKQQGVNFVRLKGDHLQRAILHARAFREEMRNGAVPALAKKNEWLIRRGPGVMQFRPMQEAIVWLYHRVLDLMERQSPPEVRRMLVEMARESGLPVAQTRKAFFQPESLMLLSRVSIMKHVLGDLPQGGLPGCSSAVVTRDWTREGRLLACRNLDYPIVGPWEKHPLVIFQEPTELGMIPHVSITSAGLHASGLTSINREGITIASHAHFGREVALTGTPIMEIGSQIASRARTIGEAVDIVRKHKRFVNWAFVVSSAKENDAVVIEIGPRDAHVRHPKDGLLVHSNYFHTKDFQKSEAMVSGGCTSDLYARVCRLRNLLEPLRGQVTVSDMARALGDHVDEATGEERVFGNTVSVVTTVTSVVFDPSAQKFWMSRASESPTGLGPYLEVDIEKFWGTSAEADLPEIEGYQPKHPELRQGVRKYREAYQAWHMECDKPDYHEKTLRALKDALAVFPLDGNVWTQAGLVAFRMGEFNEASGFFNQAIARNISTHTRDVGRLFLARCHDLNGNREDALAIYRTADQVEDLKLRKAMKRGARRPYRGQWKNLMMLDLQWPDAIEY